MVRDLPRVSLLTNNQSTFGLLDSGIEICMFFQSIHYLTAGSTSRKTKQFYVLYGAILLVLITISLAANAFYGQSMWIEHRDVDGGPVAYFSDNTALWYNTLGTVTDMTANAMGDGLMVRLNSVYFFFMEGTHMASAYCIAISVLHNLE